MNRANLWAAIIGIVVLLFLVNSSLFVVNQAQQALVLRFGAVRQVIRAPGLYVKAPVIDNIVRYDARLLDVDPPAEEVILSDQKRIVVDTYTRFTIQDPEHFYQAVRNEDGARARLREIINSAARRVLGNVDLPSVLSPKREDVMHQIQTQVAAESRQLGIAVVDVRIRRADLPPETSQAIYRRMQSERQREAAQARAEGQQRAQEIRAGADRDRTILLAQAQLQAQILRGEGDGQASRTYADAYSQDPNFFAFYRSLDAYKQALANGDTSYVLSPASDFFKYFSASPAKH